MMAGVLGTPVRTVITPAKPWQKLSTAVGSGPGNVNESSALDRTPPHAPCARPHSHGMWSLK
jgi:hypothetical protein